MINDILRLVEPYFSPSDQDYNEIKSIDSSMTFLSTKELLTYYDTISQQVSQTISFGPGSWNAISSGMCQPSNYLSELPEVHALYQQYIQFCCQNCVGLDHIEDGGVKTIQRMYNKIQLVGYCSDSTRMRIIFRDLPSLLFSIDGIIECFSRTFTQVSSRNYYLGYENKYHTYRKGINTSRIYLNNAVCSEVQFVTKRMNLCTSLNHPLDVSRVIHYENEHQKTYLTDFIIKASILDLLDVLHQ